MPGEVEQETMLTTLAARVEEEAALLTLCLVPTNLVLQRLIL